MPNIITTPHGAGAFELRGDYVLHRIDYARELARSVNGRPAAPPSCLHEEHRQGVCPHGNRHHDARDVEGRNTIVAAPKAALVALLTGTAAMDLLITAIAVGTSAAATTAAMTQLDAEFYRIAPSDVIPTGATKASAFWFLSIAVGNAPSSLQEFGILAGGATDVAGTGGLVGRFLQTFAKNSATTQSGQYDLNVNS